VGQRVDKAEAGTEDASEAEADTEDASRKASCQWWMAWAGAQKAADGSGRRANGGTTEGNGGAVVAVARTAVAVQQVVAWRAVVRRAVAVAVASVRKFWSHECARQSNGRTRAKLGLRYVRQLSPIYSSIN
jgi:hypothetical protein